MFHRGWPSPPMRCQGFSRTRITRARYPEMLCFFAVTSVTHPLARSFVFHSFPSFFLRKIQPSFAVTPFFIPHNTPLLCWSIHFFGQKVGHSPQSVGHSSQKVGHFPENNGHFWEKVGHSPQKVGKKCTDQSPRLAQSSTFRASNP